MKTSAYSRVLRAACILALIGLSLMVWSILDPTPMPVMVAMSLGQLFGTLSLGAFLVVVVADMRRAHLERPPTSSMPPANRKA